MAAALLGACSSSTDADALFEPVGAGAEEVAASGDASTGSAADRNDAIAAYLEFVAGVDDAMNGIDVQLSAVAADAVVAEVIDRVTANVDGRAEGDVFAVEAQSTTAEPTIVTWGTEVVIDDCQRVELVDYALRDVVRYVHQQATLVRSGDGWEVSAVDVVHDGRPTVELACVPGAEADRAIELMETYNVELAGARAQPVPELPAGLAAVVGEPLEGQLAETNAELVERGLTMPAPQDERYEVRGIETLTVGTVVRVTQCAHLPDGRRFHRIDDGVEVETGFEMAPGIAIAMDVSVRLEPVPEVFKINQSVVGSACWDGGPGL